MRRTPSEHVLLVEPGRVLGSASGSSSSSTLIDSLGNTGRPGGVI